MQLKPKGILDKLLLIGTAVLLICAVLASKWAVDRYRLSPLLLPGFWLGLLSGVIGFQTVRSKFKRQGFVIFFAAWLALEDVGATWAAWRGGLAWTVGAMLAGLFVLFLLTSLLFGPINTEPSKPGEPNDSTRNDGS